MKKLTLYSLYMMGFWFAVFFINRLFFVIYQMPIGNKIKNEGDIVKSFYKGYQLDLSMGATFILPPLLFIILFYITRKSFAKKIALVIIALLLVLYICVGLADTGLYREWNAKLNMQALEHFKNPGEVFKTVSTKLLLLFVVLLLGMGVPFYFFYRQKIHLKLQFEDQVSLGKRILFGVLFFMVSTTVGVFTIRGGVDNMPINQSIAYFSNDPMANDIAVNPLYNLLQDFDIKSKLPDTSIYKKTSNAEAQRLIASDYTVGKDSTISILKTARPNIVYIFLESWSADNVSVLGGIEGCTPQFDKLCEEGLLFSRAYGEAYVSDQGIVAGLSAYPSAHRMAIANQPPKIHNLPCISEELIPLGYSTSFLFGGELVYGNLRGYLLEKKFAELKEVYDLRKYPEGKLGVHDEYTFKELLQMLNNKKRPFLQGFFTTSTHMPYDYEPADDWQSKKEDPVKAYTESVHYSDFHLGKFFAEAKKQPWYDSTLFVIVADHSHNSIKDWSTMSAMRQHIPLLFVGGAIKEEWRGRKWEKIVSQLDIVSTVLHQMNIDTKRYPWSRNMLNPYTPSSAFFVFFGGGGYLTETGYASTTYDNLSHIDNDLKDSVLIKAYITKSLAFQQLVFENVRLRK